eukprot:TRINITY_DN54984_c0_g1_i1.p1 TRINITY_DN54984_c0_g1~~TRINITY_DN54984_c0_g1_i1.p1  ORF type:complete len:476 (+),score=50.82 TRINITY_DN54984_c0_g1_i1:150-1577(+)
MPPRAVVCELCGGKFFRSSLAIHQKTCRTKVGLQMHECPYCHAGVPMLEMDTHVMRCPAAKSAGARPTGASASLARRLETNVKRAQAGLPHPSEIEDTRGFGGGGGDGPSEYAEEGDVRIACQICGRKFNMDRVTKHQAICEKLKSKPKRREMLPQRAYMEGGSGGACIGVAASPPSGRGRGRRVMAGETNLASKPKPPPPKTNWREASLSWRQAIRSGRQNPMPRWGEDTSSYGGRGNRSSYGARGGASPSRPARMQPARGGGGGGDFSSSGHRGTRARAAAGPQAAAVSRTSEPPSYEEYGNGADDQPSAERTESEIAMMKQEFQKLDVNGDGSLELRELRSLMMTGNPRMSNRQMDMLFGYIDKDGSGRVDFEEFVDFVFEDERVLNRIQASARMGSSRSRLSATTRATPARPSQSVSPARGGAAARPSGRTGGRNLGSTRSSAAPLPEWGSGASSYGRNCMTSPPGTSLRR